MLLGILKGGMTICVPEAVIPSQLYDFGEYAFGLRIWRELLAQAMKFVSRAKAGITKFGQSNGIIMNFLLIVLPFSVMKSSRPSRSVES